MIKSFLRKVRDFLIDPVRLPVAGIEASSARIEGSLHRTHLALLAASPRYADPRCLTRYGYKSTSQNDEDGILDEIFRRIGTTNRFFIEFGVETGVENNTLGLLLGGWSGLWIEGDVAAQVKIRESFSTALSSGLLKLEEVYVTVENIESTLSAAIAPQEPDLLSIDIDGNDYWIWKAIRRLRPRVVVIEYNATLGRSARAVQPYDPSYRWDNTTAFGASLGALEDLGRAKGYSLVCCNLPGVNAFFVRNDLVNGHFLDPFTAETHYEPPRYGPNGAGHRVRWLRFEETPTP
jgi:methyltransferase FkbM-like protein